MTAPPGIPEAPLCELHQPFARTVSLNTEPGELINRLLGTSEDDV
jgi:hypothetical protein